MLFKKLKFNSQFEKYVIMNSKTPIILEIIFVSIAYLLYSSTGNIFYLFNFVFIGTAISIGAYFMLKGYKHARNMMMLIVGSYLLIYVGIIRQENLSMSGFWYYLGLGVFEAAVIHFLIAKIAGPLYFGRVWCGYACWTAMIFDLLPYKTHNDERKNWGYIRYILFVAIFCLVVSLFVLKVANLDLIMFYLFVGGNLIYYVVGIILAFYLKDNRAFCKYICPITVFLKTFSYFSYKRVKVDADKCVECKSCIKSCPMDVDMLNNSRKRENGTECILCGTCIENCPKNALET